ncbi:adhesin [uncultured Nitrosomonas sp.]|uniref:adhesin n=1 Tax=uncultured Nitrosomonas sp. TaxID=156424 RepID=UPI0025EBF644|nr:adhesin [uncultured Nitrosomonas sp.]
MKSTHSFKKNSWITLLSTAFIVGLVACDSSENTATTSSSSTSATKRNMPTGPAVGILVDSPVSGVSYNASSGKSGTTDEQGNFNFNHGDKIEFKLGGLTLGNIPGSQIVTPIELAGDNNNKLQNLLVLLQSLDSDSNLSNGISISQETAAAVKGSIDLNSNPETFAESANLKSIMEAGSIEGEARTPEEARDHFMSQGVALLSAQIWVSYTDQTASVLRVAADSSGEYLQGDARPDDSCDENRVCSGRTIFQAGVEAGVVSAVDFDNRGFKLVGKPTIDTNLRAGLSDPGPTRRVRTDGFELMYSDIVTVQREREKTSVFGELFHIAKPIELSNENEVAEKEVKETRFAKIDNDATGIIGAWAYDENAIKTQTLVFFPNGKFLMIDPTGEAQREDQAECGKPGIEFASYSYDKGSNKLDLSRFTYNTNGCVGFSHQEGSANFSISSDGTTAQLEKSREPSITLYRVSK